MPKASFRTTPLTTLAALAVFTAAVAAPAHAADKPPLQPIDVFALEAGNDPQISPDGTRVAYVRLKADIVTDAYQPMLWLIDADGRNHVPLTRIEDAASDPRWSPDGKRLAFVATRSGARQIVVRWMESGVETTIGGFPGAPMGLEWSPDGRTLAYAMHVPAAPKSYGTPITPPPGATWKPGPIVVDKALYRQDGAGIIPPGQMHIFTVPASGGTPRQITRDDTGEFPLIGSPYAWMADSKGLVVALNRNDENAILKGKMFDTGLYLLPLDGSAMKTLIDRDGPEASPQVSPDGRYIAYIGADEAGRWHTTTRLMVLDTNTGERRVLSAALDRDMMAPRWAADGRGIYAYYADRGENRLALFDLKGGRREIAEGLGMAHIAYTAAPAFTVSRTGRVAMQWAAPDSSGNIALAGTGIGKARSITGLNEALFAGRALGRVEEINYRSSKGDLPVQGWLIYPPDFDPAKKYPLIMEIHGGPNAAYGPLFDMEKQLMAAAGYVVFYPNVRGSTSYGEPYANLIENAFPGDEFDDLMSGVDAVVARGFIDASRLYVTGGSGGGTLSAWLIARSERFRAAAVLYPVIDWQSQALTSDILPLVFKGFFFGTPWSQPDDYRRRSLLASVDKVKTPTMVMTGEADYRTPISESEQYFAALKYHGVESVFVRVPLENHGIRMFPSHFAQKVAGVIGWFETHK